MAFTFEKTKLPGVVIIQPQVFGDSRGYFMETYKKQPYAEAGIDKEFVQDISRKRFSNLVMEKKRIRRVTTYTSKNDRLRCVAGWVGCS